MKPGAQPRPRQDSQRDKDALGRTAPKGDRANSASPPEGFSGSPADAGQVNHPTTSENVPAAPCGAGLEAWRGSSIAMPDRKSTRLNYSHYSASRMPTSSLN